jgi:hypothetical protein
MEFNAHESHGILLADAATVHGFLEDVRDLVG